MPRDLRGASGPWFFASFGGGWRFVPDLRDGREGTRAVWKYTCEDQTVLDAL